MEKVSATPPVALFDLKNDPGETHNLATANPAKTAELEKQLVEICGAHYLDGAHGDEALDKD
jgi:arylsulfatase A-like enzyme